jgi:geranylgeranyl pyrophosphate synthase
MSFELTTWSALARQELDTWLDARLEPSWPPVFIEAVRYPVFGGGKRVRPLLTLATAEAMGVAREKALPAAAAVELIHTYSLVHDDLPAMDDDAERRGRPTVHIAFDEATAILSGDALLTEAFTLLARAPLPAQTRIDLVDELSHAAGYRGMVGGQAGDMGLGGAVDDLDTLLRVHRMKTGALIRCAVRMGAHVADADPATLEALTTYGEAVGLAFQLADDVLDEEQDAGPDGPPSYVRLLGVEETTRRAHALAAKAEAAIDGLQAPDALRALARFTVERSV